MLAHTLIQHSLINAPDNHPFSLIYLKNKQDMQICLTDWGASLLSAKIPVAGTLREVICGCDLKHFAHNGAYLGATIGRFANRINKGRFRLNGKTHYLTKNQNNQHTLHGGEVGFDKRRWQIQRISESAVLFQLFSYDGDQGFAGNVECQVQYKLTADNRICIEFSALSDKDTPLNLTNHSYFNLDGTEKLADIRQHYLQINADYFLPVDKNGIPNQPLTSVSHTGFDFRQAKQIAQHFLQDKEQQVVAGYDHAFLLHNAEHTCLKTAAKLTSSNGDLSMTLSTTQPALQLYTGNFLQGTPHFNGQYYRNFTGVALEAQALPDAINHPEWYRYGGITLAHRPYQQSIEFKFDAEN